jgi:hypothetical protein
MGAAAGPRWRAWISIPRRAMLRVSTKRTREVSITYGPSKIKGTFVSFVPRPKPASPAPWPEKENHKPEPKDELKEGVSSRLS